MLRNVILFVGVLCVAVFLVACGSDEANDDDFGGNRNLDDNPLLTMDDFLANGNTAAAIDASGFTVYDGAAAPAVVGSYATAGEVIKAHDSIASVLNTPIKSTIIFSEQDDAEIDMSEKDVYGNLLQHKNLLVSGSDSAFTLWLGMKEKGDGVSIPSNCSLFLTILFSGTQDDSGDIDARILTTIVGTDGCDVKDDVIYGLWYLSEVGLTLQGDGSEAEQELDARVREAAAGLFRSPFSLLP